VSAIGGLNRYEQVEVACACLGFRLWYVEVDVEVCHCGHPRGEHHDAAPEKCHGITLREI
jgi:hypothetical protein